MATKKKAKLPKDFKWLLWGYKVEAMNFIDNKRIIVINTLNYGNLKQWKKLIEVYGWQNLRETIRNIPESEFRKQIVKLIKLLFRINKFKYATRSAQIKAERGI